MRSRSHRNGAPRPIRCLLYFAKAAAAVFFMAILARDFPVVAQAQGQSGDNPMRNMMRQMMQGAVPPPGMTAESLPEPGSREVELLVTYCTQCHDLPSPRYKTAAQWPEVFQRMDRRMNMMGGMMGGGMMMGTRIQAPSSGEARALLAYLVRNSMVPALPEELAPGAQADRAVFETTCSDCHALPSPHLHPPEGWPATVARMDINRQNMDKQPITTQTRAAVLRFLLATSRPAAGKP